MNLDTCETGRIVTTVIPPPRPGAYRPRHRRPRLLTRLRRYEPVDVQFRALFDDPEPTRSAA